MTENNNRATERQEMRETESKRRETDEEESDR
jgi:hypothetical protein